MLLANKYRSICDAFYLQFLAVIEANVTNDDVTEMQHTVCKITTEDVIANARATVTTVLTGACKASK